MVDRMNIHRVAYFVFITPLVLFLIAGNVLYIVEIISSYTDYLYPAVDNLSFFYINIPYLGFCAFFIFFLYKKASSQINLKNFFLIIVFLAIIFSSIIMNAILAMASTAVFASKTEDIKNLGLFDQNLEQGYDDLMYYFPSSAPSDSLCDYSYYHKNVWILGDTVNVNLTVTFEKSEDYEKYKAEAFAKYDGVTSEKDGFIRITNDMRNSYHDTISRNRFSYSDKLLTVKYSFRLLYKEELSDE